MGEGKEAPRGRAIMERFLRVGEDPDATRHPQRTYRALESGPTVVRGEDYGVLVRSADVVHEVLRHPEIFASGAGAMNMQTLRPPIPLMIDPPDHKKYRKLLDPIFAPQRMAPLEAPVADLVNTLIDAFVDDPEVDFAQQFSVPFPSQVFLTLFGLPMDDLPKFLRWKDGVMHADLLLGKPQGHPDVAEEMKRSSGAIYAYMSEVIAARRGERRDDIVSHFLDAEVDGERLTDDEILDICFTLFNAGLDTVSASLDCFFLYLAEHPEQRRRIVEDPSIIPRAVEELLRWETPVMQVLRGTVAASEIGGCPIRSGEFVSVMLGSANLDPAEFDEPYEVRLDRESNRHYAFGAGIHRCLGSHLARLELRVALREWHRRLPDYAVKPGADIRVSPTVRSIESLPLLLGAPPPAG